MEKLLNILLCLLITVNFGYSQSIKRHVINSFGSSSSTTNSTLETTFGQPSNIGTISNGNNYIRQGFQQPLYQISVLGCTDPLALDYNPNASIDNGSCTYCVYGCTDPTQSNYDSSATCDNNSCTPYSFGCMDPAAINYNPFATASDGSCLIAGCTDPLALNYNPVANFNDGSCIIPIYGCLDSLADNYNPSATVDDGSCTYCVHGCTDTTQFNYNSAATCDDGSCIPFLYGCIDSLAINYNSSANTDDASCLYAGCTDPAASNYNPSATVDDGSCIITSSCIEDAPTGLFVSDIIHDRAVINWDNMNSATCFVDQYRIKYRIVGTSSWSNKTMSAPVGSCTFQSNKTDKILGNLTASSTYEYQMKAWYCGGGNSSWTAINTFTTLDNWPNVGNLAVYGSTTTKATFTWDDSNGPYTFARLKARVDSISNPTGSDFFSIGGAGVNYPTFTKNKNGLVPGETYRGQARTWCDPNGGAYRSPSWTSLVYWTQPTIRVEGGESITNLDIYPNPSRDIFNISFTSETVQNLRVRVLNVVGEEIILEDLQQFVGEYVKYINLNQYAIGIYFLEIETNNGVINKKLVLQ